MFDIVAFSHRCIALENGAVTFFFNVGDDAAVFDQQPVVFPLKLSVLVLKLVNLLLVLAFLFVRLSFNRFNPLARSIKAFVEILDLSLPDALLSAGLFALLLQLLVKRFSLFANKLLIRDFLLAFPFCDLRPKCIVLDLQFLFEVLPLGS
jgi:hypothetical protein